nr:mast cell carboxypeptidase A [Ipomoea batatas]
MSMPKLMPPRAKLLSRPSIAIFIIPGSGALLEEIESLVHRHPDKLSIETFSNKNRGYQAETTIVTYCQGGKDCDDRSKVRILLTFGQHGRELITTELALRILSILSDEEFLPKQYPLTLNNTLDKLVIKIVPMENVNGRKLVEKGELCERRNGRGVDLNRNWSVDWGKKEKDYDPYEENPGTSPFSEPETQLMRKLSTSFEPHIWVNVHSGMEANCTCKALFMPYDHKNTTPDGFLSQRMKMMLEKLNHFHLNNRCLVGSGGGSVGYLAHGTATDYMYDIVRVPMAFTFEVCVIITKSLVSCGVLFGIIDKQKFNPKKGLREFWVSSKPSLISLMLIQRRWLLTLLKLSLSSFFFMFSCPTNQLNPMEDFLSSSSFEKWVSIDDYLNGYLMERRSRYGKKMEVLELGMQEIRTYFRLFLLSSVLLLFMFCSRISKSSRQIVSAMPF